MLPASNAEVFHTENGTPYLKESGVVMISRPDVQLFRMHKFLEGFNTSLEFTDYLNDPSKDMGRGEHLCKTAGQLCYMSFGPKRTKNENSRKYFENIISSGHGSVLEHANYSFLLYGVSRSAIFEMVRHRAGMAYSQVSQRYVDGSKLRFVERPEFQNNNELHRRFESRIDEYKLEYSLLADKLVEKIEIDGLIEGLSYTDKRKKVNQTARAVLPNETEAPIIVTGNIRAWRHILEMRGSPHAESEIRNLAIKLFELLKNQEPILFMDFHKETISGEECVIRRELAD